MIKITMKPLKPKVVDLMAEKCYVNDRKHKRNQRTSIDRVQATILNQVWPK